MTGVWYMLQDSDKYVYHYTRCATLVEHILPGGSLRFSRFRNLNDPRESKDFTFNYYTNEGRDLGFDTESISLQLNDRLKHICRIGCFVSDVYEALVTNDREDCGEDIIGALYERGHSRPRMWAQYGQDYQGACLVFDRAQFDVEIKAAAKARALDVYGGPVIYRNPKILPQIGRPGPLAISIDDVCRQGIEETVEAHFVSYWQELFFVKPQDWEQEREYRWLLRMDSDDDFFVEFGNSLVGILLGDHFPVSLKPAVGQYGLANDLEIAEMQWQNGVPQPNPTYAPLLSSAN